ncbi:hypothetical protein M3P36_14590 [Altererythrobacter sp. KTW20L]|uniref:hypothetical protein n=1 Tax=Altererythrobacter sp. KTW20L TaxID=2942210 RepID=UPI0020C0DE12|nr:hypothetical protein [Altererythrobacter sp. KTW20L]MCL6252267.1 hypothetical protein [Altererythrobacter sp. KTW20L]
MAKTDNSAVADHEPDEAKNPQREALALVRTLGSLEEVLNSGVSLEIKAACIEMEIEARQRRQQREGDRYGQDD